MNVIAVAAGISLALLTVARAAPPIEAYGELPNISAMALSPDGKHFAYIRRQDGVEFFVVSKVGGDLVGAARGGFKARNVSFAGTQHAIFIASETTLLSGFSSKWENSGAISYNVASKEMKLLLRDTEDLFPAQTGLGRIVGALKDSTSVFMPAFMAEPGADPTHDLLMVDLDTGRGRRHARGSHDTEDWFVDGDGTVLAREDIREEEHLHRILTRRNGKLEEVYEEKFANLPSLGLYGLAADKQALVVGQVPEGQQFAMLSLLSFDGKLSPPIYGAADKSVESVVTDLNRVVIGAKFSGMTPSYDFADRALAEAMDAITALYADASAHLVDWTDDYGMLLVYIEGGERAPGYYLYNAGKKTIGKIAPSYERIGDSDVGLATPIEYKARDGRTIPAILTTPPGVALGTKLPLIVMPHGGPEAYDQIGFDYLAQYFASRGYLVFQPNFRGSDGFGLDHLEAGYGEWGGKMQDDVTDGVNLLVRKNWADGDRACIVGGSYGGYAALAGGAFTPDLYKCVAAIAPVSDLNAMLTEERADGGKDSLTFAYWRKLIGDQRADKEKIRTISPVNAAASFKAPVLLLHGSDDTVVPFSQSAKMESALKKAGKSVRLVKLKGEDHWLSGGETRLQALKELDAFVAEHLGAN